jgi:hypothetical protein
LPTILRWCHDFQFTCLYANKFSDHKLCEKLQSLRVKAYYRFSSEA